MAGIECQGQRGLALLLQALPISLLEHNYLYFSFFLRQVGNGSSWDAGVDAQAWALLVFRQVGTLPQPLLLQAAHCPPGSPLQDLPIPLPASSRQLQVPALWAPEWAPD